mmetsp:Transcript_29888/g.68575  ORF Transcript_29888/g.68575 Transcript_29888/m.68575 type:complete len:106 (+) Transcript_29888:239-556(+)
MADEEHYDGCDFDESVMLSPPSLRDDDDDDDDSSPLLRYRDVLLRLHRSRPRRLRILFDTGPLRGRTEDPRQDVVRRTRGRRIHGGMDPARRFPRTYNATDGETI